MYCKVDVLPEKKLKTKTNIGDSSINAKSKLPKTHLLLSKKKIRYIISNQFCQIFSMPQV